MTAEIIAARRRKLYARVEPGLRRRAWRRTLRRIGADR